VSGHGLAGAAGCQGCALPARPARRGQLPATAPGGRAAASYPPPWRAVFRRTGGILGTFPAFSGASASRETGRSPSGERQRGGPREGAPSYMESQPCLPRADSINDHLQISLLEIYIYIYTYILAGDLPLCWGKAPDVRSRFPSPLVSFTPLST